jgi:hypothetical protein
MPYFMFSMLRVKYETSGFCSFIKNIKSLILVSKQSKTKGDRLACNTNNQNKFTGQCNIKDKSQIF